MALLQNQTRTIGCFAHNSPILQIVQILASALFLIEVSTFKLSVTLSNLNQPLQKFCRCSCWVFALPSEIKDFYS